MASRPPTRHSRLGILGNPGSIALGYSCRHPTRGSPQGGGGRYRGELASPVLCTWDPNFASSTVKTRIIGRCAMSLDFPLLVRSRNFYFFLCLGGGGEGEGAVFLLCFYSVFAPLSREGNSGLHSTPSNYSSFYGYWHSYPHLPGHTP